MARIWFYGKVLNNQDPLNLGRVRAQVLSTDSQAVSQSVENFNPLTDSWTEKDPFVFNSFLPLYIYAVPKEEELVQIYYHDDATSNFLNAYYIQGPFSRVQNIVLENYLQSQRLGDIQGLRQKSAQFIKNPDGTYKNSDPEGVFPDPGDISIMGRGTTDLVLKENEVLLRAGKYQANLMGNTDPVGNPNRAFLQLSKFDYTRTVQPNKTVFDVKTNNPQVKFLIEWHINNPENQFQIFNGNCTLYRLIPNPQTLSNAFLNDVTNNVELYKIIVAQEIFTTSGITETIDFINLFIKTCNSKQKTKNGTKLFNSLEERFPIFFRPTVSNYNFLQSDNQQTKDNLTSIFQKIKLNNNDEKGGYGLIYENGKVGKPIEILRRIFNQVKTNAVPTTYATLVANRTYLLSQNSQIPGKEKINFRNNLYGITEQQFNEIILPRTSSMVRGEELMQLINYIVRFLISHTHNYPGESVNPVAVGGGTNVEELTTLLNEAYDKVLNQNIRLN
jgi:hypothetical protein